MEKTTRVFRKKQLLNYGLCAIVVVGLVFCMHLDPFGVETCVPNRGDVVSVEVESNYDSTAFTTTEHINAVLALHEAVLPYRDCFSLNAAQYFNQVDISFTYTLENGRTLKRNYALNLEVRLEDYASGEAEHPLLKPLDGLINSPRWLFAKLQAEASTAEKCAAQALQTTTEAQVIRGLSDLKLGTVSNPEVMETLRQGTFKDLEDGNAWLDESYRNESTIIFYRADFCIYEEGDAAVVDRSGLPSQRAIAYFPTEHSAVAELIKKLAEQYGWADPYDPNIWGR